MFYTERGIRSVECTSPSLVYIIGGGVSLAFSVATFDARSSGLQTSTKRDIHIHCVALLFRHARLEGSGPEETEMDGRWEEGCLLYMVGCGGIVVQVAELRNVKFGVTVVFGGRCALCCAN